MLFLFATFTPAPLSLSPGFRECISIYIISDGVPEPDPEQFTVSLSTDNVLVSIEEETAVVVIFEGKFMKQTRNAYNGHPRNALVYRLLCIHKHYITFLMGNNS